MSNKLLFLKEFALNFKMVGAITPSSKFLTKDIMKEINFKGVEVIVELGGGTGVFTKELISLKESETILVVFEKNYVFYKKLRKLFKNHNNVYILLGCASNLKKKINSIGIKKVDYIISGLPFSNFSSNEAELIFKEIQKVLNGELILFQYTLKLKNILSNYFHISKIKKIYFNLPPAYIIKGNKK